MLEQTVHELEERLGEACATASVRDESTAELVRLEENLAEAARAAKQAVSLRRRLRTQHPADAPAATPDAPDAPAAPPVSAEPHVDAHPTTVHAAYPGPGGGDAREAEARAAAEHAAVSADAVREIHDGEGRRWRVWAVTAQQLHARRAGAPRRLGEFDDGWLAFEQLDGGGRRRLAHYPPEWRALPESALAECLLRATPVRTRHAAPPSPGERPEAMG